jgi:tRNA-binding protein
LICGRRYRLNPAGASVPGVISAGLACRVVATETVVAPLPHRIQQQTGNYMETETAKPAPVKPVIAFNDLQKVDIRVGTIQSVEDVTDSRKLVCLTVSFGDHQRAILAGLKQEREDPAVLVGSQALFVVNLAPRKMAGMVSEGMVLDIGYEDGIVPVIVQPVHTGDQILF